MESIDYSHGGGSVPGIKSVDYCHGTAGGYQPPRELPPRPPNYPSFGGPGSEYAGVYGEGGSFMGYGSPALAAGPGGFMGTAGGLDPAAIFAAYQGGIYYIHSAHSTSKRLTVLDYWRVGVI